MQGLHIDDRFWLSFQGFTENPGRALKQRIAPLLDLVRVNVEILRQLNQRLLALDPSYAGIWVTRPNQAARFSATLAATPSVNVTPSMTKGNWFAPFRRRHVLAAA